MSQTWDIAPIGDRLSDGEVAALARLRIELGQHEDPAGPSGDGGDDNGRETP